MEKSINKLPESFYIESYRVNGEYTDFGIQTNPMADKITRDDFLKFIENQSIAKHNINIITMNLAYISILYISPGHCDNKIKSNYNLENVSYKNIDNFFKFPKISTKYIKDNYPEMINILEQGHKVIIGYCMCNHNDCICKKNVYYIDFIESRFKTSLFIEFLVMKLLIQEMHEIGFICVPMNLLPKEAGFWYYAIDCDINQIKNKFKQKPDLEELVHFRKFEQNIISKLNKDIPHELFNPCQIIIAEAYNNIENHINIENYIKLLNEVIEKI